MRMQRCNALSRWLAAVAILGLAGNASAEGELDLAIKSGCIACHRGAEKLIGPPYRDVAKKYAGQKDAVRTVADHIVKGTGPEGVGWTKEGKAILPFMPANAGVKPKDAETLANWVLAMQGEIPGLAQYVTQRLSVSGAVEHKLDLSVDDLRGFPAADVRELAIVSRAQATQGQTQRFTGVPLRTVLEKAVLVFPGHHDPKKTIIVATASDGYAVVFTWNEVFNTPVGEGVLVYFARDGKPLAEDEGRIALISTQDINRGGRHVRWLKAIDVRKAID